MIFGADMVWRLALHITFFFKLLFQQQVTMYLKNEKKCDETWFIKQALQKRTFIGILFV